MPVELVGEAIFLPADPPRRGRLALWGRQRRDHLVPPKVARSFSLAPGVPAGSAPPISQELGEPIGEVREAGGDPAAPPEAHVPGSPWGDGRGSYGSDDVELVFGSAVSVRRRRVPATLVGIADVLPALLAVQPDPSGQRVPHTLAVWSAAAAAGVGLVARGRMVPTVTADGYDAWRVGPLDPADLAWLRDLAAACPPAAHALAVPGSRPLRLRSPESLIRDFWDAIADTMARTTAAPVTVAAPAFAAAEATDVGRLREWLAETRGSLSAGAVLGLRIEVHRITDGEVEDDIKNTTDAAGDADMAFRAVLQLRSTVDPSLVVDAADLWTAPTSVLTRFGEQAETDMLLALRRGAAAWPPLGAALRAASPSTLDLGDDAVSELLGPAAEALGGAGIEVLWPAELVTGGLRLQAEATPSPEAVAAAGFRMRTLLNFRWQVALGGEVLTEAEVNALAEAKRPLVRLRGRWVTVDPELLAKLRRPPRKAMRAVEALAATLSGEVEVEADGGRVPIVATGDLADLAERIRSVAEAPGDLAAPTGLVATLRPYQRRGVAWLAAMCDLGLGGCLADDMGLGKTIQVIALHLHRREADAGPTLVVCPTSLLGTWERELHRFAPSLPVRRYHGGDRHLDDVAPDEVVLVTYGVVRRDRPELAGIQWGLVVADEAQHAKNPLSRTARELRELPSSARVALTGTPVENRLSELWSILDWTTPGLLGTLDGFRQRVAVPVERYRDPGATASFAKMVRPFLLRRRKSDPGIAPELPPKTETDRIVGLTAEQATLYEAVVRETMAEIREAAGIARSGLVFQLLTALKQICNHPAHYLKQAGPMPGRSGKLAAFDELVDVIVDGGESVLVFTQYTEMATLLEKHLASRGIGSLFLHGGVPVRRREAMVADFQAGKVPVFLLSLKAGGTGLTLTRATHVLHYDRWWNPAVEDQATDRAYRIGQDRPVQVHRLIAEGTVEDRIAALLESKRELADAVVGAGEGWIAQLSNAELAELVALRAPETV
jgi:hypothetical protein